MDDKQSSSSGQSSSSWDDLIKQIGAAPAPDALERKRPAIETKFEPPAHSAPPPKPKGGDWNALANTLGIEVPPEPPRAKPPAAPAPKHVTTRGELESSFAGMEPLESEFEEIIEEEISEIEFEDDDSDLEDDSDLAEEFSEGSEDEEDDTLSGDAARSAFDALFSSGSFAALPPTPKPVRKPEEPRRPGPRWRDSQSSHDEAFDDLEPAESASDDEEPQEESSESSESTGADESGRPRRRRRRRRGGRGREGAPRSGRTDEKTPARDPDADDAETDEFSDAVGGDESDEPEVEGEVSTDAEEGDRLPRRRRVRRRRRRSGSSEPGEERPAPAARNGRTAPSKRDHDDDDDEEEVDEDDEEITVSAGRDADGDEDEDDDGDSPRMSHKNIPTWSEAIGVMVETNLQSRQNSPSRPSSGGRDRDRGGRGRGRGRGRGPRTS